MASRKTPPQAANDARARARQMQAEQQRKDRRRRSLTIWGSVLAGLLAVAVIVGFVLTRGNPQVSAVGTVPAVVNEEGGVTLTSSTELADSGLGAREVNREDVPAPSQQGQSTQPESIPGLGAPEQGQPAQIVLYVDFNCIHCFEFERDNAEQIKEWVDAGQATVEYRMVDFLSAPNNRNYSLRSANAAYCVAAENPEAYGAFVTDLFLSWEEHQGRGLSNEEIAQRAQAAGADVSGCLDDGTYRPAVAYATAKAQAAGVRGTPTVFVNGKNWAVDGPDQSFQEWAGGMIER
ncbi:DsbA family protein [Micrococcus sp.]|uniref:DsbA family protein n=1 Tax=Micrococcus sp. TaxID=1271 RepID=UPI002A90CA97|nr:thioredoxin domain-containing protein [Micrococcus sp.]MDY6055772.1 thioredoxin domain-containing protein [Micrococcus sp.]